MEPPALQEHHHRHPVSQVVKRAQGRYAEQRWQYEKPTSTHQHAKHLQNQRRKEARVASPGTKHAENEKQKGWDIQCLSQWWASKPQIGQREQQVPVELDHELQLQELIETKASDEHVAQGQPSVRQPAHKEMQQKQNDGYLNQQLHRSHVSQRAEEAEDHGLSPRTGNHWGSGGGLRGYIYKHLARERHSASFEEASKLSKSKSCRSNAFANFGLQRAMSLDVCA